MEAGFVALSLIGFNEIRVEEGTRSCRGGAPSFPGPVFAAFARFNCSVETAGLIFGVCDGEDRTLAVEEGALGIVDLRADGLGSPLKVGRPEDTSGWTEFGGKNVP